MSKSDVKILSEQLATSAEAVLGSMLIDPEAVGPMLMALDERDFKLPQLRAIFLALKDRYGKGLPTDPVLINEDLGGSYRELIGQMAAQTPTSANAGEYAALLKKSSQLWELREIGEALVQAEDPDACRELIDRANLLLCNRSGIRKLSMRDGFLDFFKRHDQSKKPDHIKWGFPDLDEQIHVGPGDFVVIGGYPSAGKTAFSLQLAFHIAKEKRVGFFSYETAVDKLHDRTVSSQTGTSFSRIQSGRLQDDDYKRVVDMRKHLTEPKMDFLETSGMTVSGIGSYAMAMHYDVIVVDYLQKIPAVRAGRYLSDFERVSQVSNDLQRLGRTTGKVVIALSQLNRPDKGEEAPKLTSLRQSGQIEQDADVVLLLYKEDPKEAFSRRCLDVAKNKDGVSGVGLLLNFDGDHQRFSKAVGQPLPKKEPPAQQDLFHPEPSVGPTPFDREEPSP